MPLVAVARSGLGRQRSSTMLGFDMLERCSSFNLDWMRSVNSSYSSAYNCSPTASTFSARSRRCVSAETDATSREMPPMEMPLRSLEDQFCGWLWMRGNRFGKWRHRYFCLNGPVLTYFVTFPSEEFLKQASPRALGLSSGSGSAAAALPSLHFGDGSQPRGVVRVAHVDDTDVRSRLGFKIFGTCGKSIDIRAHSVDERNQWLRMLKTPARRKSRAWSSGETPQLAMNLSAFDPDVTCTFDRQSIATQRSGWMHKRSDVLRRWRRYFFVIQDRMLSYYTSDKPYEVPRRRGYVQSVQTVAPKIDSDGVRGNPELLVLIGIRGQHKQRELRLRLDSFEELESWKGALTLALAMGDDASRSSASTSALSMSAFSPAV